MTRLLRRLQGIGGAYHLPHLQFHRIALGALLLPIAVGARFNGWRRQEDGWIRRMAIEGFDWVHPYNRNSFMDFDVLGRPYIYCRTYWQRFLIDIGRDV